MNIELTRAAEQALNLPPRRSANILEFPSGPTFSQKVRVTWDTTIFENYTAFLQPWRIGIFGLASGAVNYGWLWDSGTIEKGKIQDEQPIAVESPPIEFADRSEYVIVADCGDFEAVHESGDTYLIKHAPELERRPVEGGGVQMSTLHFSKWKQQIQV